MGSVRVGMRFRIVLFHTTMGMPFARLDLPAILFRGKARHDLEEGRQIPDRLVLQAAFRPGRHAGCLDAMLDDPEPASIGAAGVGGLCRLGEIRWYRIEALANFGV